jgi:4-oxalocrotonate tautomerase
MPVCHIFMMEGRTVEQKRALIAKVSEAVRDSLDAPLESVRVILTEMPKEHFGIGGKPAADLGR